VPDTDAYLANAPRRRGLGIDTLLVGHLDLSPRDVVVELGCGSGFTLAEAAAGTADVRVVGLDRDGEALRSAHSLLNEAGAAFQLLQVDLNRPLPLASASAGKLICHNVLEQLGDPAALLDEAARVMRSGGRSVWSHPDYDSVVISGGDIGLTRRIVLLFCDHVDPTMDHADGQIGRKLPGLVHRSALVPARVTSNVLLSTELSGPARFRVESTVDTLRNACREGTVDLTVDELDGWKASLDQADAEGRFLYSHVTYVVVADKP